MDKSLRPVLTNKFVRYLLAGSGVALTEYVSFVALFALTHAAVFANSTSYFIGVLASFLANRYWVFNHGSHRRIGYQFALYVGLVIVNLVLVNVIVTLLNRLGLTPYVGKLISMGFIVGWNFILYKHVIFKIHPPPS